MFVVVFLLSGSLIELSSASPVANFLPNPVASAWPLPNRYDARDGSGSYRYGYTGPHHARMETRSNGVTRGGYSYIDANGILQTVAYSADAENGFRVRASNLPQQPTSESLVPVRETPEVAAARGRRLEEFDKIDKNFGGELVLDSRSTPNTFFGDYKDSRVDGGESREVESIDERDSESRNPFLLSAAEAARIEIPSPDPSLLDDNEENKIRYKNLADGAKVIPSRKIDGTVVGPITSYVSPLAPYRPSLHSSLRHTQDSLGRYDYSYVGDTSSKTESRSLDGTTRGAYSYVDANGLLQQVRYIADRNGFRVVATNLPEA